MSKPPIDWAPCDSRPHDWEIRNVPGLTIYNVPMVWRCKTCGVLVGDKESYA